MTAPHDILPSPVTFRPVTILRASPIGECVAMLIAVHALFAGISWLVTNPMSGVGLLVPLLACWIILRTVGVYSGRWVTPLVTLCGALVLGWAGQSLSHETPAWLAQGPFGPAALAVLLSLLLVADLCDIPWKRGMSFKHVAAGIVSGFARVPAWSWGWGLTGLFAVYMILLPGVEVLWEQFREPVTTSQVLEEMTFSEAVRLRTTEAFTAVWFFVLGATVGSFLNVVVYRTPRGQSLIWRRSTCPKCGSRISGRDNVPVLGWIWLNGKCRSCQMPISMRYPLVEAAVGGLFLLFYFVELLSGGRNLPVRIPNHYAGVVWIIFYTKWDLIGLFLFHCLLMVSLLAWSLIRYDGERVRWRSIGTTFTLAIAPLLIWPHLMLVPWQMGTSTMRDRSVMEALLSAGIGGITGAILGLTTLWCLTARRSSAFSEPSRRLGPTQEREFPAGLALVGVMLGWQAMLSVLPLTLMIHLALRRAAQQWKISALSRWPLTGAMLIAVMLQLLSWRFLSHSLSNRWPVTDISITALVVWFVAIAPLISWGRTRSHPGLTSAEHDRPAVGATASADEPTQKETPCPTM